MTPAGSAQIPKGAFTRRDLLIMAGLSSTAALFPVMGPAAGVETVALRDVSKGAFVHQGAHEQMLPGNLGHIANVGCIIGDEAVAVIDSGGSAMHGRQFLQAIREITDRPIRYVIATHVHPDHVFGHAAFLEEAPTFIGHAKLPGALQARGAFYLDNLRDELGDLAADTEVIMPDLLVEDSMEVDLGGRKLTLRAHETAHTDNDLTIFDHESGLLWTGDLLFMERCPVVDGSLLGWLKVMDDLEGGTATAVVPGHGPVSAAWPDAIAAQRRYLTRLLDEVRQFLDQGGLLEEAVDAVAFDDERTNWALFEHYHGRNVSAAYAELEWE
ncbi:MAG: quinoprotein relay system zinc metallohydrolase 2 [Geminicoccaceae bacterium]